MEGSSSQQYATGHTRSASAASANSLGVVPSCSLSMNSISSECSSESPLVEEEDIIVLTHDVRTFKEALGRLKKIFHKDRERQETTRVFAHERLGEVLRILRSILEKYSAIQSTELLVAAGTLIQQVKGYNYEDEKSDPSEFFEAIDQLALAFSSRVSEYLMGDLDSTSHPVTKTRSCDNLIEDDGECDPYTKDLGTADLAPTIIDNCLVQHDHGVNLALQRAKAWSKYAKDVMTYIEKRCHLDIEHARSISKLAQVMRPILKEESYLPFQSIYCTALDQDIDNANNTVATCSVIQGPKFIDQLSNRRSEHEKSRKQIKETWQRELKKMHEAISNMKKAKASYFQKQQEYEKAKESALKAENTEGTEASKVDKKRRLEDDALHKAVEAETTYKACIAEANERQVFLEKVKADILKQVRELIYQCDQTMKAVTAGYFQLQYTMSAPSPVQFQTLCESSKLYEPGKQYMEFVRRQVMPYRTIHRLVPYVFESYCSENRGEKERRSTEPSEEEILRHQALEARLSVENKDKKMPAKISSPSIKAALGSDSDSVSSCPSNKSQDTSPAASPHVPSRKILTVSSGDELETDHDNDGIYSYNRQIPMSKAAETHTFRKLKTPSRCRECDSYVYFQGVECSECSLPCHKKCLEALALQCGHKRLPRKMTTFGIELTTQPEKEEPRSEIPRIITKCVSEIESRGQFIKGIYRVSGVKSRVEKLCQSFENGAELVDLTDVPPNVIATVLKLYLRQLPEPLLTFRYYPDFINIAKHYPSLKDGYVPVDEAVKELRSLVHQLPTIHYTTLAYLMHHLKRISNQSEHNNMPPSNLGIVFGPTLLRTSEGTASLSSLVDTVHQTRIIELLINYANEIFDSTEQQSLIQTDKQKIYRTVSTTSHTSDIDVLDSNHNTSFYKSDHTIKLNKNILAHQDISDSTPLSDDLLGSSTVSDDDFPYLILPDDSTYRKSPLIQQSRSVSKQTEGIITSQHKENLTNVINSRTSQSSSPAISEASHCSFQGTPLKLFDDDSAVFIDLNSYNIKTLDEPPIPPPRKNIAHSTQNIERRLITEQYSSSTEDIGMSSQEETSQSAFTSVGLNASGNRMSTAALTAELRRQFFESPPHTSSEVSFVHLSTSSDSKGPSEAVEIKKSSSYSPLTHSNVRTSMELSASPTEKDINITFKDKDDTSSQGSCNSSLYSSPLSESISSLGHRYMPSSLSATYSGRTVLSSPGTIPIISTSRQLSSLSHSLIHNEELQTKQKNNGETQYSSRLSSKTLTSDSSQQYISAKMVTESSSIISEKIESSRQILDQSGTAVTDTLSQSELSVLVATNPSSETQYDRTSKASDRLSPNRQPRFV